MLKALRADCHSPARRPYLASVAFTAINRVMKDVTDAHDTDFSMALADLVLETDKRYLPQTARPRGPRSTRHSPISDH
ncbi:MAG: hypothetical protein ABII00_02645 [Elusimicrobiota bacterium]